MGNGGEVQSTDGTQLVLYTWECAWGLPSICPSCIYAEACCRLTGATVAVQRCTQPHNSPTGSLPALKLPDGAIVPSPAADGAKTATAKAQPAAKHAQSIADALLHRGLLQSDSDAPASVAAVRSLVQHELAPASTALAFAHANAFHKHTKPTYLRTLPWLVRQPVARSLRHAALQEIDGARVDSVYEEAKHAYAHLQSWLLSSHERPARRYTTAHLVLIAHVVFVLQAPVAEGSSLRSALNGKYQKLGKYAMEALEDLFPYSLPSPPKAEPTAHAPQYEPTDAFKRGRNRFVVACITSVVGYALLGGLIDFDIEEADVDDADPAIDEDDNGDENLDDA